MKGGSLPALRSVQRAIVTNAGSLVGTTGVTSGLGFAYWWLAARHFDPDVVGLASAAISAMTLLGAAGTLGLGTLLIGELSRHPGKEGTLISTALTVAACVGGGLGVLFAIVAAHLSTNLRPLASSSASVVFFALGVSLAAIALVVDEALIGLLIGRLQFWRNLVLAVVKLGALVAVGVWWADGSGLLIYATWTVGNVVSLVSLTLLAAVRGDGISEYRPRWRSLRGLARAALGHYALNLALQFPNLALPVVVTVLLTATTSAHFYVAWLVAGMVFVGPVALATVLYAVSAATPTALTAKVRFTLGLALAAVLVANVVLLVSGDQILRLFGPVYAAQAGWCLHILGLGAFPLIVKDHYVAICRVYGQVTDAALRVAAGGCLELLLAALGGVVGGLTGMSLGWVGAVCIEAACLARPVLRVALPASTQSGTARPHAGDTSQTGG